VELKFTKAIVAFRLGDAHNYRDYRLTSESAFNVPEPPTTEEEKIKTGRKRT
jgi:hypothetical protein